MSEKQQPMSDKEICEWVKDTCLNFGASLYTSYTVAGLFIKGLQDER